MSGQGNFLPHVCSNNSYQYSAQTLVCTDQPYTGQFGLDGTKVTSITQMLEDKKGCRGHYKCLQLKLYNINHAGGCFVQYYQIVCMYHVKARILYQFFPPNTVYVHMHIHACIHTNTRTCVHTCTHIHTHTR